MREGCRVMWKEGEGEVRWEGNGGKKIGVRGWVELGGRDPHQICDVEDVKEERLKVAGGKDQGRPPLLG